MGGEAVGWMWLGAVIARRIWHQRKTPGIHISGSGRLRWVSLHPAALSSWSRTTFSVGLHASRRHGQLHGNNPAQNLGPSRLCILDTAFVRYSLSASILGAEPRPITIAFRIWNLHCQAQRRVQPRRAQGNRKRLRRPPGVGWHAWLDGMSPPSSENNERAQSEAHKHTNSGCCKRAEQKNSRDEDLHGRLQPLRKRHLLTRPHW